MDQDEESGSVVTTDSSSLPEKSSDEAIMLRQACQQATALIRETKVLRGHVLERMQTPDTRADEALLTSLKQLSLSDDTQDAGLADILCHQGHYEDALQLLRPVVARLGTEHFACWNYIRSLEETGRFDELISSAPLLDSLAEKSGGRISLYRQLSNARLAKIADRPAVTEALAALQNSALWIRPEDLYDRVRQAMATGEAFSLIASSYHEVTLPVVTSLLANILLRPAEVQETADAVWQKEFGETFADSGPQQIARAGQLLRQAVTEASVLCLPEATVLQNDNPHFGFFALQDKEYRTGRYGAFAGMNSLNDYAASDPGLKKLLADLPFLGVVSTQPGLAARIGAVCDIPAVSEHLTLNAETGQPLSLATTMSFAEELWVPFPGAVFLVAGGMAAPLICGEIRRKGGIALHVTSCLHTWAE